MKTTEAEVYEAVVTESQTDKIRAKNRELALGWQNTHLYFLQKISSFSRFGSNPIDAAVLEGETSSDTGREKLSATFFTEKYQYTIVATMPWITETEGDSGYLGATVNCRKPRAGEDWTRGSDLADGNYDDETWHRILCDIIGHELVRLGK